MTKQTNRNYKIDNMKAIAIFCIVLGHFIESFEKSTNMTYILNFIYMFHIPILVFCSGYLAKLNSTKLIKRMLIPYIVISTIFYFFYNYIVMQQLPLQYIFPYHSLWYMISLMSWYILIPFFDGFKNKGLVFLITIIISLLIGYDVNAGLVFSVSRTIVFLPIFIFGYNFKKYDFEKKINAKLNIKKIKLILIILMLGIITFSIINYKRIDVAWMYGAYNYKYLSYNPLIRLSLYAISFIFIMFFWYFIPNKKMIISKIGERSISIYLLHDFFVQYARYINILMMGSHPIINCFIATVIVMIVLSNKFFYYLFRGFPKKKYKENKV